MLAFVLGYGVWAAAPAVIGSRAPWDGSWPYYSIILVGVSALIAVLLPKNYGAVFAGTLLGQLLAELRLPHSAGELGFAYSRYDWIGAVLTFPGTWIGSAIRNRLERAT